MAKSKANTTSSASFNYDEPLTPQNAFTSSDSDAEKAIASVSAQALADKLKPVPRILVLDRGFVLIGICVDLTTVGLYLECTRIKCIRSWGTTEGLGQLVSGPTENTKFDATIHREVIPVRAILRAIDVDLDKWKSIYPKGSY